MSAPQEFSGAKQSNDGLMMIRIDACTLPEWDTVLRHTKVAHQACSNFVFVGWDARLRSMDQCFSRAMRTGLPTNTRGCAVSLWVTRNLLTSWHATIDLSQKRRRVVAA